MRQRTHWIFLWVVILVGTTFALECYDCNGDDCKKKTVKTKICDNAIIPPPAPPPPVSPPSAPAASGPAAPSNGTSSGGGGNSTAAGRTLETGDGRAVAVETVKQACNLKIQEKKIIYKGCGAVASATGGEIIVKPEKSGKNTTICTCTKDKCNNDGLCSTYHSANKNNGAKPDAVVQTGKTMIGGFLIILLTHRHLLYDHGR